MNPSVPDDFSGAIQVSVDGAIVFARAYGAADRARGIANTLETRFALASGTKLLTALGVGVLVDDGRLALDARLCDVVRVPLPGVSRDVTIAHLLGHTSGVYDYLDEDVIADSEAFALSVAPSTLLTPSDYLPMLCAGPAKFAPGERFSYSNGGYVLLGLAIEAAAGCGYHEHITRRVLAPCGMSRSGFFRFDALPPEVALGYLGDGRTSAEVLPIIGGPDGGVFATVGDVDRLWRGLLDGAVLSPALGARFVRDGFGVFHGDGALYIEGGDAGVSFRSTVHDRRTIATVVSNTTRGAWPVVDALGVPRSPP